MSRSSSTGVPAWEPGIISGQNNSSIQDLFDDQSIDWATLDRQSQDLDLSNLGQAKPDHFYWPVPQPSTNSGSPLDSPLEFGHGMPPLLFDSQSTVPQAGYEPSESNPPILDPSRPPATTQPQEQPPQRPRFPHSYSESTVLSNPSSQSSLSYSHSVSSATSATSTTSTTSSSTSNAGQCISLCTQIIAHLDSHIGDRRLGLDGVLRISKSCISGLLHITGLESCRVSPNCLLLLCVAVNQMSTLFETNIPAMDSLSLSLSAPLTTTLPSVLFGSFQVDHEDQLAFCTRLVGREVQRCRQLLDRIGAIHHHQQQSQSQAQNPNNSDSAASLLQKQWFLALAARLDRLAAAVTA